jgi:hypothetical protein
MAKNTHMLGADVEYIDSKKHPKLAKVIAVPGQIKPGSNLTPLTKGFYNVIVFSPSGQSYVRGEVPDYETAKGIKDCLDSEGNPSNFIQVLEDHFVPPEDGVPVQKKDEPLDEDDDDDEDDEDDIEDEFGLPL